MTFTEAPLSINFKPGKDFDAPLLTIRANTPEELEQRVNGVSQGPLFGAIVNAQTGFKAAYNVANVLGGVSESAPAPQAAPQAAAPAQGGFPEASPWGGNPGPAAQAPQQQYMAAAAAGAAAGGYTPQPAATPAASAGAPFIPAFGMSATFRSGQGPRGPWSAYFDPRPKAVTDAIAPDHTGKAPSTDDVNHPGLAAGTHKFAKFLR